MICLEGFAEDEHEKANTSSSSSSSSVDGINDHGDDDDDDDTLNISSLYRRQFLLCQHSFMPPAQYFEYP